MRPGRCRRPGKPENPDVRGLKWPPLSRPIFDRNKLRIGGYDFRSGAAEAAPAIPALEPALRSHSCVDPSSAKVLLLCRTKNSHFWPERAKFRGVGGRA